MITIVSGLPRSGTSLLMQMLDAGGFPILCDGLRRADEDNPQGYFEYDPVRRLEQDNRWLVEAEGRALKVVSPLLYHLPLHFTYRLIFIQRSLDEMLRSQAQMLARNGRGVASQDQSLHLHMERHLRALETWLEQQPNFSRLTLAYADVVAMPRVTAQRLAEFLDTDLDLERMAAVVDPALYRQRTA